MKEELIFLKNNCKYPTDVAERIVKFISGLGENKKLFHYATEFEKSKIEILLLSNQITDGYVRVHDAVLIPCYNGRELNYDDKYFKLNVFANYN